MIQSGGRQRTLAIGAIYQNLELKNRIMHHVRKYGGDQQEAQDVFHEGIISLDRNIRSQKFKQETSIEGYLFSICRFTWNNLWRKKSKTSSNEITEQSIDLDIQPDSILLSQEKRQYLEKVLELIDESCRKILTLWKASYSMQEIADACELSSKEMAKKYRYRCMKKLMSALEDQPKLISILRHV